MPSGIIVKSTGSWSSVRTDDGKIIECRIRGKFRTSGLRTTNPVAVGDVVTFEMIESDNVGTITHISDRKNYIIRKSSNLSREAHILASNIDNAFLVITVKAPKTPIEFIDRFLATAEAYSVPVFIIINKIDLYNSEEISEVEQIEDIYNGIGYKVIRTSVFDGLNIEELNRITAGKLNFFSGNSGVGKSSLINALHPDNILKTGEVSEYHLQGKHTTTFAEMVVLQNGGYAIDSPGIRGFGMVRMEKSELSHYFPEIFAKSSDCQFYNCQHLTEPGCAVRKAVDEGKIAISRYNSYVNLYVDEDEKYRAAY